MLVLTTVSRCSNPWVWMFRDSSNVARNPAYFIVAEPIGVTHQGTISSVTALTPKLSRRPLAKRPVGGRLERLVEGHWL